MSCVQFGMPDIEKFTPAAIWSHRLFQRAAMSPLHTAAALRWMPAKPERDQDEQALVRLVARAARRPCRRRARAR